MTVTVQTDKQGRQIYHDHTPFTFYCGQSIPELILAFETYGKLNSAKDNAILIHHALSTDSHVASTDANLDKGWWGEMVGPGRAIDTDKYYVICINNIGSCFGSSGPRCLNPKTDKPYRASFPTVTMADIAASQHRLLQYLGIEHLAAIIGPSMGAMISLSWLALYPQSAAKAVLISSCSRAHPTNVAIRTIQREMISLDTNWQSGNYDDNTLLPGFMLARKFGHITYRSQDELNQRFQANIPIDEQITAINAYLDHNARKFTQRFDVDSYCLLTKAMDLFDVRKHQNHLDDAFAAIEADILVVAASSDTLYPPYQQEEIYQQLVTAGGQGRYECLTTQYGHDAFLVEIQRVGALIQQHLA